MLCLGSKYLWDLGSLQLNGWPGSPRLAFSTAADRQDGLNGLEYLLKQSAPMEGRGWAWAD